MIEDCEVSRADDAGDCTVTEGTGVSARSESDPNKNAMAQKNAEMLRRRSMRSSLLCICPNQRRGVHGPSTRRLVHRIPPIRARFNDDLLAAKCPACDSGGRTDSTLDIITLVGGSGA